MTLKTIARLIPTTIDDDLLKAYSYDCSLIQQTPKAVAWFKNIESLRKMLVIANQEGFSITARGFGTNISGSAINNNLILSFEKFMGVEDSNDKELWVDVRAGTRISEVNKILSKKGLYLPFNFVDNPSVGGLIARNLPCDYSVRGFAVDNLLQAQVFDGTGKFYRFKKSSQIAKLSTEGSAFIVVRARLKVVETPVVESQRHISYSTPELAIGKANALLKHPKIVSVFILNPISSKILGLGNYYTVIARLLNEGEEPWFNPSFFIQKVWSVGLKKQHHVITKDIKNFLIKTTNLGLPTMSYMPSGFSIITFNGDREKIFNIARDCYNPAATGFGVAFKNLTPDNIKRRFRLIKEEFDYNNILNRGKVIDYR